MVKNFLLITLRNILRNKSSSYINITGLIFSTAICLFIFHFVYFELNYDSDPHSQGIYRVETCQFENQEIYSINAHTSHAAAFYLRNRFDEIERFTRLVSFSEEGTGLFRKPKTDSSYSNVYIEKVFYAEESIVNVFNLSLETGNPDSCLSHPNSILLSGSTAKSVFEKELSLGESIIGKTLKSPGLGSVVEEYIVTGVFKDPPTNKHIKFDALVSMNGGIGKQALESIDTYSYVSIGDQSVISEELKNGANDPNSDGKLMLRPISEIHLASGISGNPEPGTDKLSLVFSSIIAIIILLLASTNHINNTIFNSIDRSKEIGVRKLLGIKPKQLFLTLMGEAFLVNLIAMFLSIILFRIGIQLVRVQVGIPVPPLTQVDITYAWFILGLLLFSTLLSGTYPALYLTSLSPIASLKSKYGLMNSDQFSTAGRIIKCLLVFQLGISVCFLSGLYIVHSQLTYLKEVRQSPIRLSLTGIFPGASGAGGKFTDQVYYELDEYKKTNALESYSVSNLYNGEVKTIQYLDFDSINVPIKLRVMDHQSLKAVDPHFMGGRNFFQVFGRDEGNAIVTKATMLAAGYKHPDSILNQTLVSKGSRWKVIGVIDKFNEAAEAEIIVTGFRYRTYLNVVLNYPGGKGETLNQFLNKNEYYLSKALPFFSLFKRNYQKRDTSEKHVLSIFLFLSIITLVIANIGTLGLASFVTQKRQKEIGIRKVLGAESINILSILIFDFIRLMGMASIIAVPLVLLVSQKWLENYAYRISLDSTLIIFPLLVVMLITIVVVLEKCFKLALTSPLHALRQ